MMARCLCTAACLLALSAEVAAYPKDGYPETGIRRLEYVRLIEAGELSGRGLPRGATLNSDAVDIRFAGQDFAIPSPDEPLSEQLRMLLGDKADAYGLSLLDLSDPNDIVYAQHREDLRQNVGSVGKLVGAVGFFQALADAYPDDAAARHELLYTTTIEADRFSHSDHHTIRLFDVQNRTSERRAMRDGDQGNVYEYLDWALSISSNSAAAMFMRDGMLLRGLGDQYPLPPEAVTPYFQSLSGKQRTELFQATFWEPVSRNGLSLAEIRQGSFFTREGKHIVNGGGRSYATPKTLLELALRMEQGRLVDTWSSRLLKRLLYLTDRRIRYASSPALADAAVYFKSGSLYSCAAEEGFKCGAYRGNVRNYMNSVAIIEDSSGERPLHYIVTLISNVLRENSAVAHQHLAGEIHRLIMARHAPAPADAGAVSDPGE